MYNATLLLFSSFFFRLPSPIFFFFSCLGGAFILSSFNFQLAESKLSSSIQWNSIYIYIGRNIINLKSQVSVAAGYNTKKNLKTNNLMNSHLGPGRSPRYSILELELELKLKLKQSLSSWIKSKKKEGSLMIECPPKKGSEVSRRRKELCYKRGAPNEFVSEEVWSIISQLKLVSSIF